MSVLFQQSAVRVRAGAVTDPYGNPSHERDWAHATRTPLPHVNVQPDGPSEEETGDRQAVTTGWRLSTRRGTDADIIPTDRIEALGLTLEVDGEIARYEVGGSVHHVEARLRRVIG